MGPTLGRSPPAIGLCATRAGLSKAATCALINSREREMARAGCVGGRSSCSLFKPGAHTLAALGAAAAKGRSAALLSMNWQLVRMAVSTLGRSGHAQQLGNLETATTRATGHVTHAADQRLERMITGLAVILIERHTRNLSSVFEAKAVHRSRRADQRVELPASQVSSGYSESQARGCQCWKDWLDSCRARYWNQ
jgi:hypothetical protein